MKFITTLLLCFLVSGCLGHPETVEPVDDFHLAPYLGTWYEIARLDHSFERGLSNVTASYSLREDGGVKVVNRGFSSDDNQWREAEGKAYFVDDPNTGYLKVSFFGPFYSSYVIFALDDDYQYAFISGANHDYLWLLARTPQVSEALIGQFKREASARGFDADAIIMVDQTKNI